MTMTSEAPPVTAPARVAASFLTGLEALESGRTVPQRPRTVCIVTPDIAGPIRNGGIGTAYREMALALAAHGHSVTVLYTHGCHSETDGVEAWIERYAAQGVTLVPLPEEPAAIEAMHTPKVAYRVHRWLSERRFDIVHFPEWGGTGFYALAARRQGVAHRDTVMVVTAHSPTLWHRISNGEMVSSLDHVVTDFCERRSVEWADVLVSPSAFMLRWMAEAGWTLPPRSVVQQNILTPPDGAAATQAPRRPVEELVFFGRLEPRKGLFDFCDALDRLVASGGPLPARVIFLGKLAPRADIDVAAVLAARAERWPFPHAIVGDKDTAAALALLAAPGRLAVMPSRLENSPYTVLEALAHGVPFVARATGGIAELIHPGDRTDTVYDGPGPVLAQCLAAVLTDGARIARPSVPFTETRAGWCKAHDAGFWTNAGTATEDASGEPPLVSICIAHHNRPRDLVQAVGSALAQSHPRCEVLVVDDGSTDPAVPALLDRLERDHAGRLRVIRQDNRYLGAARNRAAAEARGEYLLFLDDDNLARPEEVAIFVAAARRTGADVLTCVTEVFEGDDPPAPGTTPAAVWLPLGGAVAAGFYNNVFGDANALVRRDTFLTLGGFTEEHGLGHEDWEFFAKAALAGHRVECVPEPLYWYRRRPSGMLLSQRARSDNFLRSVRPYLAAAPADWRPLLLHALGLKQAADTAPVQPSGAVSSDSAPLLHSALADRAAWLEAELAAVHRSTSWRLTAPVRWIGRWLSKQR
ncbi:glycosyltransferase [Azospirillum brasilense]|nr:glycosyltransferase [Azospirillum brasilense]NUB30504.1 glycosyltransferase [Azospirillum brasilense]